MWQSRSEVVSEQISRRSSAHHVNIASPGVHRFLSPCWVQSPVSANEWTRGKLWRSFSVFLRLWACGLCGLSHSGELCGIFLATGWVESGPTQNRWQTQAMREEGCFPMGRKPGLIMKGREKPREKADDCVCGFNWDALRSFSFVVINAKKSRLS